MNESQVTHTTLEPRSPGGVAIAVPPDREIAELRHANTSLQRRLEESELRADFRMRADRLLAIPLPESR